MTLFLILLRGYRFSFLSTRAASKCGHAPVLSSVTFARKYPLAALIQGVTTAFPHHLPQSTLHRPDLVRLGLEFRKLFLREPLPAFRCPRGRTKAEKKLADLLQGKTQSPCPLYHREAVKHGAVVTPLPADSVRAGQQADLLVVADCRRSQSNSSSHFGDSQQRHAESLNGSTSAGAGGDKHFTKLPLALKPT